MTSFLSNLSGVNRTTNSSSSVSNEAFNAMLALEPSWICHKVSSVPLPLPSLVLKGILVFFLMTILAGGGRRVAPEKFGHITKAELTIILYQVLTSVWSYIVIEKHTSLMQSSWQDHEARVFLMSMSNGTLTLLTTISQLLFKYPEERAPAFRGDIFRLIEDTQQLADILRDGDIASAWAVDHKRVWTHTECSDLAAAWAAKEVEVLSANAGGHQWWMLLTPFTYQIALGIEPKQAHYMSVRIFQRGMIRRSSSIQDAVADLNATFLAGEMDPSGTAEMYLPCDALQEYLGPIPESSPGGPFMQKLKRCWTMSGMPNAALTHLPGGSRLWAIAVCCIALAPRLASIGSYGILGIMWYWQLWLFLLVCAAFTFFNGRRVMTKKVRWNLTKCLRHFHILICVYAAVGFILDVVTYPNLVSEINRSSPGTFIFTQWVLWTWIGMLVFIRLMNVATGAPGNCFFSSGELRASLTILLTLLVQCFPQFVVVSDAGVGIDAAPELVLSKRSLIGYGDCLYSKFATSIGAAEAFSLP